MILSMQFKKCCRIHAAVVEVVSLVVLILQMSCFVCFAFALNPTLFCSVVHTGRGDACEFCTARKGNSCWLP